MLLLDRRSGPAHLYLADPTHKAKAATVDVSPPPNGEIHFVLPSGDRAGSTVSVSLQATGR
jgi:hypothetical protein